MTTAGPELPAAPRTLEELFTETVPDPLLLLVVGPGRSGTSDDPLAAGPTDPVDPVAACLEVFRRGHVPLVAEAMALPLAAAAGSTPPGDVPIAGVLHPYASRLLAHCDGIVRVGGPSSHADEMVALGAARGVRVWTSVDAVPHVAVGHPA